MKQYSADKVRNVAILGHSGSGKTSLAEAILFKAGAISRTGKREDKNTVMDFDDEEKKRLISIGTSVASCEWEGVKLNLIDTPGDFDFLGEVVQALRVADCGIVVIEAKEGVTVGAEKAVRFLQRQDIPFAIFVNKLEDPGADFQKTMVDIRNHFGRNTTLMLLPFKEDGVYTGYVDILNRKSYRYDDANERVECETPANLQADADLQFANLKEQVAESSDAFMEKYFAEEEFTNEELRTGLKNRMSGGYMIPVWTGSSLNKRGIRFMMNRLIDNMPSAKEHAPIAAVKPDGSTENITADPNGPLAAFVFKTIADPFVGKISLFRVYSGSLKAGSTVYNANKEVDERISALAVMVGKNQENVDCIEAGDIGAITKLNHTLTGDTLCDKSHPLVLPRIVYPAAPLKMAIYPVKQGEEDKIAQGLTKLQEEDPTISYHLDPETKEMIIQGLGELQLDVIRSKLLSKYKVESELREPKVAFRETIRKAVKVQGKHKKQSGGHGQYGDVWIEFEPIEGDEIIFEEKIFGGSVPKSYFPAVEKGLMEAKETGPIEGYPVVGIKATLVDGSYHDVDSSELAFKLAASQAFKNAMEQANPVMLEPVYRVEVHVPEELMGDIMGDLNKRRGRIQGIDSKAGMSVVTADVPLVEMLRYATDLRAITQGQGWYNMEFASYQEKY